MLRATDVIARGDWQGEAKECVVLDFEARNSGRLSLETVAGEAFLLDLAEPMALRTGDALKLDDGRLVEVVGTPEPLVEISGRTPEHLLQIAWHLGNRHLSMQVAGAKLRIRRDPLIEGLVGNLGGRTRQIEAPFDPEGGAYAMARIARELPDNHGHHHHHHHHAHHGHGDHEHDHHAHNHHDHAHGPECGCGHDHHHDQAHDHGPKGHKHG